MLLNRFAAPSLPINHKSLQSKGHTFQNFVNNPPYIDRGPTANKSGEVIKCCTKIFMEIRMIYQKYIVTSARVSYAPPKLSASSGPRNNPDLQLEGTKIKTLSPLRRFGQVPSYCPRRLVSQSSMLWGRYVQGCKRIKRKTSRPFDDHRVILTTSNGVELFSSLTKWNRLCLWPSLDFRLDHHRRWGDGFLLKIFLKRNITKRQKFRVWLR